MEQLAGAGTPVDFSLIALFARASLTVQIVMVILVLASVWAWAIIIRKIIIFNAARREADKFDRAFWSGQPLDDLYDRIGDDPKGASERIFAAGMNEWRRSHRDDGGLIAGATARIDRAMSVAINRESDRLTAGLPFLATVGSTAPFIGLFGTVWGIKTAFEEIAISQNTSLAVVAPGIAEALFATAIGLFAAIPAVLAYNKLQATVAKNQSRLEGFADEFSAILSRQIDERLSLVA